MPQLFGILPGQRPGPDEVTFVELPDPSGERLAKVIEFLLGGADDDLEEADE